MPVYRYSQEVHDFVKKWSLKLRDEDLAEACNSELGTHFTAQSMKAFRGNHGYRNGKKQWTKEEYWKYQKKYPQGMYEFVRDNSWGVSSKEMAEMVNEKFGTSFTQTMMKQFRQRHGIKSGCTGWYQKGHPPGTKGRKQEDYIKDPDALERAKATRFKKGDRPANELPVGAIVVNSAGYKLRKKQMEGSLWERWEFLHRAVWEEHNGPIPEGVVVIFKDNDKLNCDIENLMLITKGESCALTRLGYRFEDPDLTQAGLGIVRLKQTVAKKKKKGKKA
ncbi:HNH endonuclease [bacterium 1XD8-76]|nr:HNH endonuclease [bacterium 1XD8-76]